MIGNSSMRAYVLAVILTIVAGTFVSCGLDSGDAAAGDDDIQLADVWTRSTAPGADSTAFYVTITNTSDVDDEVVGAESPHCASAELHVSSSEDGVMSMSPARTDDLRVSSSQQLRLEPGGLHIMCMGLKMPVAGGDDVQLTVHFEQAGAVTAKASVETG